MAENIVNVDPGVLNRPVPTSTLQFKTAYKLTQDKRSHSVCRPIKRENRASGIHAARLQPDFETARAAGLRPFYFERTRTHDAAMLPEEQPTSLTQPTDVIPGSVKWPEPRNQNSAEYQ